MYGALRRVLFHVDPERAHHLALAAMAPAHASPLLRRAVAAPAPSPRLAVRAFGIAVPAPLGVAAGFDKEARAYNALLALGFGHVEVGTVTPRPQPGNERPRIERHAAERALVNRMGFPGPGMAAVAAALARHPPAGAVGANVGPNKTTAPGNVAEDLRMAAAAVAPRSAFVTLNVSSPNTPGLRALQTPEGVARLVGAVGEALDGMGSRRPVLVKLHPDATDAELVAVARAAVDAGAAGIIATNTTQARPAGLEGAMAGGLSGAPLRERARAAIAALHHGLGRDVPIVGVGGVFTGDDAFGHILAGATLVQAYTGFIYEGPGMAWRAHDGILAGLDRRGLDRVAEAVGAETPSRLP